MDGGNYPPYACPCCGYANGDMFYDYFKGLGREPTKEEDALLVGYMKAWSMLNKERQKAKDAQFRRLVYYKPNQTKQPVGSEEEL